jgi:hypothetical protein
VSPGSLDNALINIVDFYEKEIDRTIDTILNILEPALMLATLAGATGSNTSRISYLFPMDFCPPTVSDILHHLELYYRNIITIAGNHTIIQVVQESYLTSVNLIFMS